MAITTEIKEKFITIFNEDGWEYIHYEDRPVLEAANENLPLKGNSNIFGTWIFNLL